MANINKLVSDVEKKYQVNEVPKDMHIGDTVDVHVKVVEGSKERIQIFNGVVISISNSGSRKNFTVRRLVGQYGVERKFPFHSPSVAKVVVRKKGKIRRAKLYYLRSRTGTSARVQERRVLKSKATKAQSTTRLEEKDPPVKEPEANTATPSVVAEETPQEVQVK